MHTRASRRLLASACTIAALALLAVPATAQTCLRNLTARVVVFDQPLMYNRLGAQNVNGIMYALRRDVVETSTGLPEAAGGSLSPGNVTLRPDKSPRPLVLRVRIGDCLTVSFQNLLSPPPNPFYPGEVRSGMPFNLDKDDQVADRHASFHVTGMQLVNSYADDASYVGDNASSVVPSGGSATYKLYAEHEGQYVINSYGVTFGGEGQGGNTAGGMFGELIVEPKDSAIYRSQLTREEMDLATTGTTLPLENDIRAGRGRKPRPGTVGHPIIDYDAIYPTKSGAGGGPRKPRPKTGKTVWDKEGKGGLPIINMICTETHVGAGATCTPGEIVHSEINAVIAYGPSGTMEAPGPGNVHDGKLGHFPDETYPLESKGYRNPTVPNRLEPFRDFASVWHDEVVTAQVLPLWYEDPVLSHTLHGVRDSFMINYRSGGIGSEIIASRLGIGPMHDCLTCAYEEFFLASSTVGDPGQLVDVPANVGLEDCAPDGTGCGATGPKANYVLFPEDPANVHHSYTGDFVKFRNVHGGPAEQHIFHLHNHQWLFNPNDDNSNYLDAQGLGPGAGYTYEINFGGSGNRNKTAGDAIFHCHFYPHFAQGMWYLLRVHDVFENGTELAVSDGGIHTEPFALLNGTPANNQGIVDAGVTPVTAGFETTTRALPDGEVVVGTPIPAVVPLPGKPMAPMPGEVVIVAKDAGSKATPGVPDGIADSSQVKVVNRTVNPGFPFWIAGHEHTVGQRPTTPLMDMLSQTQAQDIVANAQPGDLLGNHPGFAAAADGWDGGLPRFTVEGYLGGGDSMQVQTRLDFSKEITKAKPYFYPETGTDLERVHMEFMAKRCHNTFYPDGTAANCDPDKDGSSDPTANADGFITNGAPPVPGAPYNDPCIDDRGALLASGVQGSFFSGELPSGELPGPGEEGLNVYGNSVFNAETPRIYKAANVQFDAVFNKLGYHFPQERIITLWEDVIPTIEKRRPPEPFVMRLNTFDCAVYHHTNLVPQVYELDDYQVRTPTDIIGQHIHLPKWDLTTADGSANGWNYEDGTLSPEMAVEVIHAINGYNTTAASPVITDVEGNPVVSSDGNTLSATNYELKPSAHPYFDSRDPGNPNGYNGKRWLGARTTTQRWFADPVVNVQGVDRGLGIIFTHDHFGPSTHQQVGLYATVLTEPAGSVWVHNETGVQLGDSSPGVNPAGRIDGGPTSWQAAIITQDNRMSNVRAGALKNFREFYLEYSDFQHAYEKGVYVGIGPNDLPINTHDPLTGYTSIDGLKDGASLAASETFRFAMQPPVRKTAEPVFPDILVSAPVCPGGVARPCPEAITADDPGMMVVNYRNEPLLPRVFDPDKTGPDGVQGAQADGKAGDLAFALQSRNDRAIAALNTKLGDAPASYAGGTCAGVFCPPINQLSALDGGDPFTPMLRVFAGDEVHVKMQAGGDEEEHVKSIHGLKWLQGGSAHGKAKNSGWRNSQTGGISEQFTFTAPVFFTKLAQIGQGDYAYTSDASVDGWAQGTWGILRNYKGLRNDLYVLPEGGPVGLGNPADFIGVCPVDAPVIEYDITAVLANDVLPNPGVTLTKSGFEPEYGLHAGGALDPDGGTLVYNSRTTGVSGYVDGVLHEKYGPLHDPTAILYVHTVDLGTDGKLLPGVPVEPIVIRASAGECIEVILRNRLRADMPDLPNRNPLQLTIIRKRNLGDPLKGVTWFGNNHVRPSSYVGMHPALVEYDVTRADGVVVGDNGVDAVVPPGGRKMYRWYAGHLEPTPSNQPGKIDLVPTPIEFGGFNISPADKIKQHQKGMVAAGVILPQGTTWVEDADDPAALRNTRTAATVYQGETRSFRDFTTVWQKNLNFYWADGDSVYNTEAEAFGVTEDPEDAGHMAINYGTEPAWFRFGVPPCNEGACEGIADAHRYYANELLDDSSTSEDESADPQTPVFTAARGQAFRLHLLMPAGSARKSSPTLHGHTWQRDPYVCPYDADLYLPGKCSMGDTGLPYDGSVGSQALGDNPMGFYMGAFQSLMPSGHFEIVVPSAGGAYQVPGDYLFRDHMGLGNLDGLWGIVRVE